MRDRDSDSQIISRRTALKTIGLSAAGAGAFLFADRLTSLTQATDALAARICETERRDVIYSQFTFEVKYHDAQGAPLPNGTEIFIVVNPEYINKNSVPAGSNVIGQVNGTDYVLLRKQDSSQEVDYVQSPNSKDQVNHLNGPKNDDKLDPLCNLKRPALGAWMINSLGTVNGERILTNDPQYVTFNDIREMSGKHDKAWFNKQPEEIAGNLPTPTPTKFPNTPTPTPTRTPRLPNPPNTGPDDDDFGAGYCVAVNEMRGNPPSPVCPDDVTIPGKSR